MSRPLTDLTGQRFGKLTVISMMEAGYKNSRYRYWLCRCDCGKEKAVMATNLTGGSTKSCGCSRKNVKEKKVRHTASICWECIHSAAPSELQCVWDKTKGDVLPEGATYKEYNGRMGNFKRVLTCPEFERMNLEGRAEE